MTSAIRCQEDGCPSRAARYLYQWQGPHMATPIVWYYCLKHARTVDACFRCGRAPATHLPYPEMYRGIRYCGDCARVMPEDRRV